jgi:hypothetical protein
MSLNIEFVERAAKGEPIAQLCREYSISGPPATSGSNASATGTMKAYRRKVAGLRALR